MEFEIGIRTEAIITRILMGRLIIILEGVRRVIHLRLGIRDMGSKSRSFGVPLFFFFTYLFGLIDVFCL